jgi:hypothetical protein
MATVRQRSIRDVQDDVRALVERGSIGRHHRIYELCRHFNDRDWLKIEQLLGAHDYLLRDSVIDLIGKESWVND